MLWYMKVTLNSNFSILKIQKTEKYFQCLGCFHTLAHKATKTNSILLFAKNVGQLQVWVIVFFQVCLFGKEGTPSSVLKGMYKARAQASSVQIISELSVLSSPHNFFLAGRQLFVFSFTVTAFSGDRSLKERKFNYDTQFLCFQM